jgi:hypothetical protein
MGQPHAMVPLCSTSGRSAYHSCRPSLIHNGMRSAGDAGQAQSRSWAPARMFSQQAAGEGAGSAGGGSSSGSGGSGQLSPFNFRNLFITMAVGAGVVAVAKNYEQERVQGMMAKSQQVAGKAAVGGPFALIDQVGGGLLEPHRTAAK